MNKVFFKIMAIFTIVLTLPVYAQKKGQSDVSTPSIQIIGAYRDISPDGKKIITGDNKILKLWDMKSGREIGNIKEKARISFVSFSSDGKRILTRTVKGSVKLWDADNCKELATLTDTKNINFTNFNTKWINIYF